jgi:hypothetical protein
MQVFTLQGVLACNFPCINNYRRAIVVSWYGEGVIAFLLSSMLTCNNACVKGYLVAIVLACRHA